MIEKLVTIVNRAGIHARPASIIVGKAKDFKCSIHFEHGGNRINAKSILGIITLAAAYDTKIKIIADGTDEQLAVDAIAALFAAKFEEE